MFATGRKNPGQLGNQKNVSSSIFKELGTPGQKSNFETSNMMSGSSFSYLKSGASLSPAPFKHKNESTFQIGSSPIVKYEQASAPKRERMASISGTKSKSNIKGNDSMGIAESFAAANPQQDQQNRTRTTSFVGALASSSQKSPAKPAQSIIDQKHRDLLNSGRTRRNTSNLDGIMGSANKGASTQNAESQYGKKYYEKKDPGFDIVTGNSRAQKAPPKTTQSQKVRLEIQNNVSTPKKPAVGIDNYEAMQMPKTKQVYTTKASMQTSPAPMTRMATEAYMKKDRGAQQSSQGRKSVMNKEYEKTMAVESSKYVYNKKAERINESQKRAASSLLNSPPKKSMKEEDHTFAETLTQDPRMVVFQERAKKREVDMRNSQSKQMNNEYGDWATEKQKLVDQRDNVSLAEKFTPDRGYVKMKQSYSYQSPVKSPMPENPAKRQLQGGNQVSIQFGSNSRKQEKEFKELSMFLRNQINDKVRRMEKEKRSDQEQEKKRQDQNLKRSKIEDEKQRERRASLAQETNLMIKQQEQARKNKVQQKKVEQQKDAKLQEELNKSQNSILAGTSSPPPKKQMTVKNKQRFITKQKALSPKEQQQQKKSGNAKFLMTSGKLKF